MILRKQNGWIVLFNNIYNKRVPAEKTFCSAVIDADNAVFCVELYGI